jgi:triosephosphate isomerase
MTTSAPIGRRPIVAGNWKMHRGGRDATDFALAMRAALGGQAPESVTVVVLPPYTALHAVHAALEGSGILLGAQDLHTSRSGAFTGGVSGPMLLDWGCTHVLAGHSERRRHDGDTIVGVASKVFAAHGAGLTPVLCVGESLEERDSGATADILHQQVTKVMEGLTVDQSARTVIAYEPVWAIGTGRTATPEQAAEGHALVRQAVASVHGEEAARGMMVLYGGSVTAANAASLLATPGVDGALVGGASLDAAAFAAIVEAAAARSAVAPSGGEPS